MENKFDIVRDGKRYAVNLNGECVSKFDERKNAEIFVEKYDSLQTIEEFSKTERDFMKRIDSYVSGCQDEYGYEFQDWIETLPWMQKAISDAIYLVLGRGRNSVSIWMMMKDGKVNIRFSETRISVKHYPEAHEKYDDLKADEDRKAFERYATMFGLEPTDFGRMVMLQGKNYRICGVKPRSPKYPILVERDGKKYKATANMIRNCLKAAS